MNLQLLNDIQSQRLTIKNLNNLNITEYLDDIKNSLTPAVTKELPPSFHDLKTIADVKNCIDYLNNEAIVLVIFYQEQYIGMIFLFESDLNTVQLGYFLDADYHGKGYASEILNALMNNLNGYQINAGVNLNNIASQNLLKKLGFKLTDSNEHSYFFEKKL